MISKYPQIVSSCDWSRYFPAITDHRFEVDPGFEDDYLTQLVKKFANKYLSIRSHT